jgi:signal transduction histidine kinase/ActR/RegA family two-component response regulator/CHASE3 domain sensor protein
MMLNGGLSIGQRLAIGFTLLFCVLGALLGTSYYWQSRSAAADEVYQSRIQPQLQSAYELKTAILHTGIAARAYQLRPGAETLAQFESRRELARGAFERLRALPMQGEGGALFERLAPRVSGYLATATEVVTRHRIGAAPGSAEEAALADSREVVVEALATFTGFQRDNAASALERAAAARAAARQSIAVAGIAAMLLFVVLALLIARSIRHPTKRLLGVAHALQEGNWQPALVFARPEGSAEPPPRSEMLQLAHAFGAAAAALERREQRMHAQRAVAEATAASLDKGEIAKAALEAICEHLHAEVGAFYWHEDETLRPVALRAPGGTLEPLAVGEGIPGQAARERRTVVVRDIPADSPFSVKLGYDAAPPKAVAAVPLAFRGELLGVLLVGSLRGLDADAIAFLELAGGRLAVGLENVRAYQEIRQLLAELEHKSGLLQDQNEELQAQSEEIQAQNEELQAQGEEIHAQNDQLKHQTEQLRAYADSLAEADRRKDEFLGVLAHELRNPMAAITNSLHTLANSPRAEHRSRAEEVIGRQARLLTRLVDDLLDVTRIARGKIQLQRETLDVAALIRDCADDYSDMADKAGVTIALDLQEGLAVDGDRARFCQIVGNLLDNAIKFARSAGRVSVSLASGPQGGEIRVRDDGAGIDAKMLACLFQPFSQGDMNLARKKGGLGLGLALTRALAELHGGSVEARSDGPGQGAEFLVRIPLATSAGTSTHAEVRAPRTARRPRRILIVEDNADAGLTLKDAMELDGHEVRLAYDADEALALGAQFAPEVVLCDIGLPTLDGYELARRMRADERYQSAFMIAVTGYAGPDDQRRAAQAGFDRHFGKPPDLDRLRELLAEHQPAQHGIEASRPAQ